MRHFELLHGDGLVPAVARATADGHADLFGDKVTAGAFHLDDDATIAPTRGCLCSRGHDACRHRGRGSEP